MTVNNNTGILSVLLLVFIAVVILPLGAEAMQEGERPFVTTWRVGWTIDEPSDILEGWTRDYVNIKVGGANGTYTIFWGDGTFDVDVSGDQRHTYTEGGDYTISIYGDFPHPSFGSRQLLSIEQWGDIQWESMAYAFQGARNMVYNAHDSPNLSSVTDMSGMFIDTYSFNGDLSTWDVSSITNMHRMFSVSAFNGNISSWDVSSVTDMSWMFSGALFFNGNISSWDVSSVTDMRNMFENAESFNGDLSTWDVSNVTDMFAMFFRAASFNGNISSWDVSNVGHMGAMFQRAHSFDQNLGNWYITINNTSIERADIPGIVGTISAQNAYLDGHNPTYTIIPGSDSDRFEVTDGNKLIMVSAATDQESYTITIAAAPPGSNYENGNTQKDIQIVLKDSDDSSGEG